jgi:transposase
MPTHRISCDAAFRGIRLYMVRTGCQWRQLPREFPPYTTVQHYWVFARPSPARTIAAC